MKSLLVLFLLATTIGCDDPVRQINNDKGDACKEKAKPPNLIEQGQYIMDHRTGLCFWTNDIRPNGYGYSNNFSLTNVPCSFKVMQLAGEGDLDEEQIKKEKQQHE